MKDHFFEYYPLSKKVSKNIWNDGIFIFDTNILLNLYKYSSENREEIFNFIQKKSNRFWMPHQFALEYQRGRLTYVGNEMIRYSKHINQLQDLTEKLEDHPFLKIRKKTIETIKKEISYINEELKKITEKYTDLYQHDPVRDKITTLFEGKVGDSYDSQKLEQIYKIGESRYTKEIPPGYKDKDKRGDKKFGDLVGWFQMIDKAKKEKEHIVFVTNERKEDWWRTQRDGKLVAPCHELIKEFFLKTNGMFFDISTMERFLEEVLPEPEIIKETKEIAKEIEDMAVTSPAVLHAPEPFLELSDSRVSDGDVVGGVDFLDANIDFLAKLNQKLDLKRKPIIKKQIKKNLKIRKRIKKQ